MVSFAIIYRGFCMKELIAITFVSFSLLIYGAWAHEEMKRNGGSYAWFPAQLVMIFVTLTYFAHYIELSAGEFSTPELVATHLFLMLASIFNFCYHFVKSEWKHS